MSTSPAPAEIARCNIRTFTVFRMFFVARFYYPIQALLFFDYGLTLEQFGILNGIWGATIVLFEVPSGALADTLGRRKLLIGASICMALGVGVLVIAPIGGGTWMFVLFVLNRVFSGLAEAAASGADEALAFDSLKAAGQEGRWGHVLERVQRMTSLAFFFTLMTGSAIYDPDWVNAALRFFGFGFSIERADLIRLPMFLTFCSSLVVLAMAIRMYEAPDHERRGLAATLAETWKQTIVGSKWIWTSVFALSVVLGAMILNSIILHFLSLSSEYWRVIKLPIGYYGMIGSGMAVMGFFMPKLARNLAENLKPGLNFLILCAIVWIGLLGVSTAIPYWGIVPTVFIYAGIQLTKFLVSRYLNEEAPSEQRATILSLLGFSTNLIFVVVSFLYGALISRIRSGYPEAAVANDAALKDMIFIESLGWFHWYFLASAIVCVLFIRFRMIRLKSK